MGSFFSSKLFFALLVIVVVAAASLAWIQYRIVQETVTPLQVLNPGGTRGKALVVFHPGLSVFPEQVTQAFAEGLVKSGWRVEITTASAQAPASVMGYDLVVLGSPVYSWAPGKPLADYIRRVGDFGNKPAVALLAAAGNADEAVKVTEELIKAAKGRAVRSLKLTTMRPNDPANKYTGSNTERAVQIAREAALSLKLEAN